MVRHGASNWINGAGIRRYRASSRCYIASRWFDGRWANVVSTVKIVSGRVGTSTLGSVAGGLNHYDSRSKVVMVSYAERKIVHC